MTTLNHRLNVFGFLRMYRIDNDVDDCGNTVMRDIVYAL